MHILLPTGSEEREVLWVGSIPVAILSSCQNMNIVALQLHNMNIFGQCPKLRFIFFAFTGCTSLESVRPELSPCTQFICSYNEWLKKRAHTGCTPPKIVHPAVNMCAPDAGYTLNFGHCWVVKIRNTSEAVLRPQYTPWQSY